MARHKRILIFVHDGRGLGHLRRLSRIAAQLQQEASVLFVTGHREAATLAPRECEFVHLPSLDSIDGRRSRHWGREPFLDSDTGRGRALRRELMMTCMKEFQPDGFVADYLPMGIDHELLPVLSYGEECRKYFIVRGVMGEPTYVRNFVLTPQARDILRDRYDAILATCDERIVDVAEEYSLTGDLRERLLYTGYVADPFDPERCQQARQERCLPSDATWVVCSAGGGKDGEDLMQRCWELALQFPECYFDLILGPRSRLCTVKEGWFGGTRIRVQQSDPANMQYRLGGADIVICRGGYNSLMEACVGHARMIVAPIATDYEQIQHPARLAAFRPLDIVVDLTELDVAMEKALNSGPVQHRFCDLQIDGGRQTARAILDDLSLGPDSRSEYQAVAI